jgi:hypothetical protein
MSAISWNPSVVWTPWAHYLSGYQDRLLGGPLGLPDLRYTVLCEATFIYFGYSP